MRSLHRGKITSQPKFLRLCFSLSISHSSLTSISQRKSHSPLPQHGAQNSNLQLNCKKNDGRAESSKNHVFPNIIPIPHYLFWKAPIYLFSRRFTSKNDNADQFGNGFTTVYPDRFYRLAFLFSNEFSHISENRLHNWYFAQPSCLSLQLCTYSLRYFPNNAISIRILSQAQIL